MSINVNVHRPQIRPDECGVYRSAGVSGQLTISLNSRDSYDGTVTLFVSDTEWNAIVAAVQAFRDSEVSEA